MMVVVLLLLCTNLLVNKLSANESNPSKLIVIDPGHGGTDPGKVGINNQLEKDINLAIALKLKTILEEQGFEVKMTRDQDVGLYSENASNKKREDLRARVAMIKECNPIIAISIHQNSYQDGSCKGAQVFYYGDSAEGEKLANAIQSAFIIHVDKSNKRQTKANESYYMLKQTAVPTVIVECGFLSNSDEAYRLTTPEYQEKVAQGISIGILDYLNLKSELPQTQEIREETTSEKD